MTAAKGTGGKAGEGRALRIVAGAAGGAGMFRRHGQV